MWFFNKKTGVALGGGSILGAAHIGALKALEEHDIKIDCISGTSVGSLVASLYAFGKSCDEIKDIGTNMKWLDVTKVSLSKYGLLSNEKLAEMIIKHLGNVNIENAEIPLSIVATDITKGKRIILEKGNLADAVRASAAIPGIFKPVTIDGKMLVDGGVFENVPITPLKKRKAKRIIAVDLLSNQPERKPKNILDVLLNTFNYMILASSQIQEEDVDLMIKPELSSFNKVSTKQTQSLIDKGYEDTKIALKQSGGIN